MNPSPVRSFRVVNRGPLDDVTIEFEESSMSIVVGENDSGKTLLTSSISFDAVNQIFVNQVETHFLEWDCKDLLQNNIHKLSDYLDSKIVGFGLEVRQNQQPSPHLIFESNPWHEDNGHIQQHGTGRYWFSVAAQNAGPTGQIKIIRPGEGVPSNTPLVSAAIYEQLASNLHIPRVHLLKYPRAVFPSVTFRVEENLSPNASNLTNVLLSLSGRSRSTFDRVSQKLDSIFPQLGQMSVFATEREQQAKISFSVDEEQRLSIDQVGAGISEALTLLTALSNSGERDIVIVEEPEAGLFPAIQQTLLDSIRDIQGSRQVVITTHSPFLLESVRPDDSIITLSRDGSSSKARTIKGEAGHALVTLGASKFVILRSSAVVVVEGKTDVGVYRHFFNKTLKENDAAIVPSGGGSVLRSLSGVLKDMVGIEPDRVVVVSDRDENWEAESTSSHLYLRCRELENFFLDYPDCISAHLGSRLYRDIAVRDVEERIVDSAERLKSEVVRLRAKWLVVKGINRKSLALERKNQLSATTVEEFVELLDEGRESIPTRLDVESAWDTAKREVDSKWAQEWKLIVPGKKVLCDIFDDFSLTYSSSGTDGIAISRLIAQQGISGDLEYLNSLIASGIGPLVTSSVTSIHRVESTEEMD